MIDSNIARIEERMTEIRARIDSLSAAPSGVTAKAPAPRTSLGPAPAEQSFHSILHRVLGVPRPVRDPDGHSVQPLSGSDQSGDSISRVVESAANRYTLDPKLISAVIEVESGGNTRAVSSAGAMGLMQLMPSNIPAGTPDPYEPAMNIDLGAKQLRALLDQFNGNLDSALAAYNAGPGAVRRYGGVPPYPETQQYVRKIKEILGRE